MRATVTPLRPRAASETRVRPAEPDAALVVRAASGEATARRKLYERHVGYIAGMTKRMLRSIEGSDDIVQDAFVLAFQKLSTLRDGAAFRPWLATIAVRLVRQRIRYARVLRMFGIHLAIDDVPLHDLAHEDLSAEARLELRAIDAALAALPASQRVAWMMRNVEGEPLELVADACGCSLATVKRWIAAADARVRACAQEEP